MQRRSFRPLRRPALPRSRPSPPRDLVAALRAGDREALARVYDLHAAHMRRIARAITGSGAEADDVVQDVFVGLPEAIQTFEERCELWGWLRRVTILEARMHVRTSRRRREVPMWPESARDERPRSGSVERIALERAVACLPAPYRAVVVLKEIEGMTHAEIARVLGISVENSCVRLHRARRMLRDLLGRRSSG